MSQVPLDSLIQSWIFGHLVCQVPLRINSHSSILTQTEDLLKSKCSVTISPDTLYGMLERWYVFRRTDRANYLEYPEYTNKEVDKFLSLKF